MPSIVEAYNPKQRRGPRGSSKGGKWIGQFESVLPRLEEIAKSILGTRYPELKDLPQKVQDKALEDTRSAYIADYQTVEYNADYAKRGVIENLRKKEIQRRLESGELMIPARTLAQFHDRFQRNIEEFMRRESGRPTDELVRKLSDILKLPTPEPKIGPKLGGLFAGLEDEAKSERVREAVRKMESDRIHNGRYMVPEILNEKGEINEKLLAETLEKFCPSFRTIGRASIFTSAKAVVSEFIQNTSDRASRDISHMSGEKVESLDSIRRSVSESIEKMGNQAFQQLVYTALAHDANQAWELGYTANPSTKDAEQWARAQGVRLSTWPAIHMTKVPKLEPFDRESASSYELTQEIVQKVQLERSRDMLEELVVTERISPRKEYASIEMPDDPAEALSNDLGVFTNTMLAKAWGHDKGWCNKSHTGYGALIQYAAAKELHGAHRFTRAEIAEMRQDFTGVFQDFLSSVQAPFTTEERFGFRKQGENQYELGTALEKLGGKGLAEHFLGGYINYPWEKQFAEKYMESHPTLPATKGKPAMRAYRDAFLKAKLSEEARIGQLIFRKLMRATWEGSQYALYKAGINELNLYRAIVLPRESIGPIGVHLPETVDLPAGRSPTANPTPAAVVPNDTIGRWLNQNYPQLSTTTPGFNVASRSADKSEAHWSGWMGSLPALTLLRNGAASSSFQPDVPNRWDGITIRVSDKTPRVVMRLRCKPGAILSVPAYGKNVAEEQEVVFLARDWLAHDFWYTKCPPTDSLPITAHPEG